MTAELFSFEHRDDRAGSFTFIIMGKRAEPGGHDPAELPQGSPIFSELPSDRRLTGIPAIWFRLDEAFRTDEKRIGPFSM